VTLKRAAVQTKGAAAYSALREAILDGRFAPGSRLTGQTLADELGMSLTPVREALRLLATQGLVEHDPHRGTRVAPLAPESIEETYRLRRVLEPMACELAAQHATADYLAEIEAAMSAFASAVDDKRHDDLPELNAILHHRIYAAAQSPLLLEFIDRLWLRIPFQAMSLVRHQEQKTAEHQAVVTAIVGRRRKAAGRAMLQHITNSTQATLARAKAMEGGSDQEVS
jgi:DNA-binding GntR family transcriptional regulator